MPRGEVKLTEDERSRTSACRPSAEIICFFKSSFFSTETSILEMYYGCFFVC